MALGCIVLTSYPGIDTPLDDATRARLIAQIQAERPTDHDSTLHPLVNASYTPSYPQSITLEHDRLAAGLPKEQSIDLSRYEAPEAPSRTSPDSDEQKPEVLAEWRTALNRAYTSATYLSSRNTNLALLETYGKNAWLVSNWTSEGELKGLETELKAVTADAESLQAERNSRQEATAAELKVLEESWKKGISGLVEVQVATEDLMQQVLEARRTAVN